MRLALSSTTILGLALLSTSAVADPGAPTPSTLLPPRSAFVVDLGAGVGVGPSYPGASDYTVYPYPVISFIAFTVPAFGTIRDDKPTRGFFFYPTFNVIGERSASDHAELTGTETIDTSYAFGAGAGFRGDGWRAFGELQYGFGGYSGVTGQIGADAIFEPMDRLAVAVGPRLNFATDDFVSTYYGVTVPEAVASGGRLSAFDASGGITSLGIAASATYAFTDRVLGYAEAGWESAVGDARDSPITEQGSANAFSFRLGLSYRFDFGGADPTPPAK
jgi:outer membrane protein